jgi:hypothetical protein
MLMVLRLPMLIDLLYLKNAILQEKWPVLSRRLRNAMTQAVKPKIGVR